MKKFSKLLLASSLLCGCAAQKPKAHVVIPRECITDVQLSDKTECRGDDMGHVRCYGLVITRKVGCERLDVQKPQK